MNTRLAALVLVAVGVGASLVAFQGERPVADAPGSDRARDEPGRAFHVTVRPADGDEVLFSTRPDVAGSAAADHPVHDPGGPTGPVNGTYSDWPSTFRNVVPLVRHLPAGAQLRLEDVRLAEAETSTRRIEAGTTLPREGVLDRDRAHALWGPSREGSLRMYLGRIPVEIVEVDEATVRYAVPVDELPDRTDVPRAEGLHVELRQAGDQLAFSLEAPHGLFSVASRCRTPGGTLQAGTYEVLDRAGGQLELRRYRSGLDHVLDGRNVSLTIDAIED